MLAHSLLSHWSFDEGEGSVAAESVSGRFDPIEFALKRGRYASPKNPQWRKGIRGNALLFDGYSTWVTAQNTEMPKDALTIEAWVAPRFYESGAEDRLSAIVNRHNRESRQGFILGVYRHGTWSLQLALEGKWVEVWSIGRPLPAFAWSHVAATYDKNTALLTLYLNGEAVSIQQAPGHLSITPCDSDLLIGKNNQSVLLDGSYLLNLFAGMIDEVKIYNRALSADEIQAGIEKDLAPYGGKIPEIRYEELGIDRSLYKDDRHRPQYHLTPPGHWMNEPHGPLYFNGQYHLFYQHNPVGPYWGQIHWGHWVSEDLVHWRDIPPALTPERDEVDPDGDWSGSAALDENGMPVLFFTAGNNRLKSNQNVGIARSTFPEDGDNDLVKWVKHPEPVIVQTEGVGLFGDFRDPFVWREEDTWYLLIGTGIPGKSGTALLYTSRDLIHWDLHGPLYENNIEEYPYLGTIWELPVLLPLGTDDEGNQKHVFLISPLGKGADVEVFYWIGTWDRANLKFIPEDKEPQLIDLGDFHFTGPSGMVDPKTGRKIIFTITQGVRTPQIDCDSGWAHSGGLPISLTLREDGRLGIAPIEELESLRGEKLVSLRDVSVDDANHQLKKVQGDMLEIRLELEADDAKRMGLKIRRSPNGEEETFVYYDAVESTLNVDRNKTTLDPQERSRGIQGGPVDLRGENLKLHLYLDRSAVEVYANGIKSLTTRVFPTRLDSLGLYLSGEGGFTVKSIDVWEMKSAY